jgi:RNA polymerase sigma-70 factor (ECF subfamily)
MSAATLSAHTSPTAGPVCWTEMVSHRNYLIRFAQRKLHDPMLAEDLVHDVFEAVMSGCAAFSGRSALRSWLTGILKNKLVDLIRDRARYHEMDAHTDDESALEYECNAARPDELAEQRERLALTLARIDRLPEGLRDVMQWRVLQDEATEVVCERLSISQDSLFVRLHRARKQLM